MKTLVNKIYQHNIKRIICLSIQLIIYMWYKKNKDPLSKTLPQIACTYYSFISFLK